MLWGQERKAAHRPSPISAQTCAGGGGLGRQQADPAQVWVSARCLLCALWPVPPVLSFSGKNSRRLKCLFKTPGDVGYNANVPAGPQIKLSV